MSKATKEFENVSPQEIQERVDGYRRELFSLRINAATQHVKDYSRFKKLRKYIARGLTYLRIQATSGNQ
jgi:large subunit ribosomal protein L29